MGAMEEKELMHRGKRRGEGPGQSLQGGPKETKEEAPERHGRRKMVLRTQLSANLLLVTGSLS